MNHFLPIPSTVSNLELSRKRQKLIVNVKTDPISKRKDVSETLIINLKTGYIIGFLIFNQLVSYLLFSEDKPFFFSSSKPSFKITPFCLNSFTIVFIISNIFTVSSLASISTASNTPSIVCFVFYFYQYPFKPLSMRLITWSQSKIYHVSLQLPGHYTGEAELKMEMSPAILLSFFYSTDPHKPY